MQGRHAVLQRGVPAAADRDRRGEGEEVEAIPHEEGAEAEAEQQPSEDPRLGSVEAPISSIDRPIPKAGGINGLHLMHSSLWHLPGLHLVGNLFRLPFTGEQALLLAAPSSRGRGLAGIVVCPVTLERKQIGSNRVFIPVAWRGQFMRDWHVIQHSGIMKQKLLRFFLRADSEVRYRCYFYLSSRMIKICSRY